MSADLSQEQRLALLPKAQRDEILAELDMDTLAYDWGYQGRPSQKLDTHEPWSLAVALAGRGFGKTLMGAQWIRQLDTNWNTLARDQSHMRFCLLGRTAGDVRDVMLEGPSGIMNIWPPSVRDRVIWTPSRRRIELPNGSVGLCFSAEEPDQLRGPAFHTSWVDELAAFKQLRSVEGEATAWQNIRIGTRLGKQPQILATTTPKRVPVIKEILSEASAKPGQVLMRRGKTVDNKYLSDAYLDVLFSLYGGTALGRQELEGEVLDDVVGAMVSEAAIEAGRVAALPAGIPWIRLIGVDPSVAERPHDECGIVVVYISNTWPIERRHAFVVDDLSVRANPAAWGKILVKAAYEHQATIIAETNQGSNLVQQLIRMSADDAGLPIPIVRDAWSSKAKAVRSEPVGAAYARGRIHHVNVLAELESQATSWVPGESGYSPDRMDALVHACAAGMFRRALINGMPGSAAIRSSARDHLQLPKETSNLSRRDVRSGLFVPGGAR